MTQLWQRGAVELAQMIRSGETTSTAVVQAHLERIAAVNPALNAIVSVLDDAAETAAAAVDQAIDDGAPLGPLAGVPFTIKENIDVAGLPTTEGLSGMAGNIVSESAPVSARLCEAGAIPIGRTNMPDMGLRVHTDSGLHGLTRNPWHPGRTAGGSSGGEGAALASGMSPIGLGNDLGGSLRNPASCCSIASIKPSMGRVPHVGSPPFDLTTIVLQLFSVEGVMARRLEDVEQGLRVVAGAHPGDPLSIPVPLDTPAPGQRRVAVVAEPPGGSIDPEIATITRRAADALSDAGHVVNEVDVPRYAEVLDVWRHLIVSDIRIGFPVLEPMLSDDVASFLQMALGLEPELTPTEVGAQWMSRRSLMTEWAEFFQKWDAILTPCWTEPPFEHDFDIASTDSVASTLELIRPVMPANALGLPSVSVPAGLTEGLPVGVLVTGARFSDLLCLEIAKGIEAADLAPVVPIDPVTG